MDNITKFASDDHRIPILIDDTIQCLRFYPSKDLDYLASGGWDSKLRLFEIKYNIINSMINFDSEILHLKKLMFTIIKSLYYLYLGKVKQVLYLQVVQMVL